MLDSGLRRKLIALLESIPALTEYQSRSTLLAGIPERHLFNRDEKYAHTDLCLIVDQAAGANWNEGKKHLDILINNALAKVGKTDSGDKIARLKEQILKDRPTMPQLIEPQKFDLTAYINQFFNDFNGVYPTLNVFAFTHASSNILTYFSSRLIDELKDQIDGVIFEITTNRISPIVISVDQVFQAICKQELNLREMNVLVSVQVKNQADAQLLRHKLEARFNGEMKHYLVVLLQNMQESEFTPLFQRADIRNWVVNIVNLQEWPKSMINEWMRCIVAECGEQLYTDAVYKHIEDVRCFFSRGYSQELFQNFIQTRLSIYAETQTR